MFAVSETVANSASGQAVLACKPRLRSAVAFASSSRLVQQTLGQRECTRILRGDRSFVHGVTPSVRLQAFAQDDPGVTPPETRSRTPYRALLSVAFMPRLQLFTKLGSW